MHLLLLWLLVVLLLARTEWPQEPFYNAHLNGDWRRRWALRNILVQSIRLSITLHDNSTSHTRDESIVWLWSLGEVVPIWIQGHKWPVCRFTAKWSSGDRWEMIFGSWMGSHTEAVIKGLASNYQVFSWRRANDRDHDSRSPTKLRMAMEWSWIVDCYLLITYVILRVIWCKQRGELLWLCYYFLGWGWTFVQQNLCPVCIAVSSQLFTNSSFYCQFYINH